MHHGLMILTFCGIGWPCVRYTMSDIGLAIYISEEWLQWDKVTIIYLRSVRCSLALSFVTV